MHSRLLAVVCGAMVLGGAAEAHALTAYVNYDSLVISAAPGEKNTLIVQPDSTGDGGAAFLVIESGIATTTAGPGCEKVARVIRCATSYDYPAPSLSLGLGDGHDTAMVTGGFYYESVDAGAGNDRLDLSKAGSFGYGAWITGGSGKDNINTENGSFDTVDCGLGADKVNADFMDELFSC